MKLLAAIKKVLDSSLEILVATVMAVLVIDVVWQVVTRFILKNPSSWTEELATFLLIWVGLLGASVALNRGSHLGIDYFVGKLSARHRLYTEIFSFVCIAVFSVLVMFIGGIRLVENILQRGQISPALGIKMGYVYLAVPVSGFFLALYSIEFLIERIIRLVKGNQFPAPHTTDSAVDLD